MKTEESVESVKAINSELERLHVMIHSKVDYDVDKGELFTQLGKMQDVLISVTKRWNGLEY